MMATLPLLAVGNSAALVTFLVYTAAVLFLAWLASYVRRGKSFVSEYFLGSRGLGMWAFALTYAATSASGGTFTGFPSKIYTHGWVLGLWIGSYLVVPICAMGLLGKRINQVARISGAITVPDVLRDRFRNSRLGLLAVTLIVFFMSFNLIGQFKAGSVILKTLLGDVALFQQGANGVRGLVAGTGDWLAGADPAYLLCLLLFGVSVVIYTTYGGFHAVVWTDVMQGLVMVAGVVIMLPLALAQVGGLDRATRTMAEMVPPRPATAVVRDASGETPTLPCWAEDSTGKLLRVVRQERDGQGRLTGRIVCLEIVGAGDQERARARVGDSLRRDLTFDDFVSTPYAHGDGKAGVYVTGPGPERKKEAGFLPLSLAFSFFFMWAISGAGQPSGMVRLMAFKDTATLRRAIFTVSIYFSLIYFPLVIIFCCARVVLPGLDLESDTIMPTMAMYLSEAARAPWLAGVLVAAPFAAVMSTVDSFLLLISSAVVRDIYQRNIHPQAGDWEIKVLTYVVTLVVGVAAVIGAVNPPQFLQDVIVYANGGLAACFLGPMVYALYWPRANAWGVGLGMLGGFLAHLAMFVAGIFTHGSFFEPYEPLNFDPLVIGLAVSFLVTPLASRLTAPPDPELVRTYFLRRPA